MRKRRQIELFSISFLDLLSGALGAVIILYVAIPKTKPVEIVPRDALAQEKLQNDLTEAKKEIQDLQRKLIDVETKVAVQISSVSAKKTPPTSKSVDLDVGFKFKGQNIVFLIDTSLSMLEEDRMGQVKAGIKMLLTSLPPHFKIEIVQFPFRQRQPFKSMWGNVRETTAFNKMDAFQFIYSLVPNGGTPTREALLFVLKNYEGVSDIVLLTDGAPTFHNSNKKDDIYDILRVARESNTHDVQINCIGVGSDFINDKSSERYQFLSLLAEQTGGFFVGF